MPERLENDLEQGNQRGNDTILYSQDSSFESPKQNRLQQTNHQETKGPCEGSGIIINNS